MCTLKQHSIQFCLFLDSVYSGNTLSTFFGDLFLLLTMLFKRQLHVPCDRGAFIFFEETRSPLFIHSTAGGRLACWEFEVIRNKATVDILVQVPGPYATVS